MKKKTQRGPRVASAGSVTGPAGSGLERSVGTDAATGVLRARRGGSTKSGAAASGCSSGDAAAEHDDDDCVCVGDAFADDDSVVSGGSTTDIARAPRAAPNEAAAAAAGVDAGVFCGGITWNTLCEVAAGTGAAGTGRARAEAVAAAVAVAAAACWRKRRHEFQRFLMPFGGRPLPINSAMRVHELPRRCCAAMTSSSSSGVHGVLTTPGPMWFR